MLNKVLQLLFASGFNVLLSMLVSVYNTHSLSPEQYGDVKYVNTTISFVSGFLLLGYFISGSRLIAIEQDKKKIREIKGLLVIILCVAILVTMSITAIICGWYYCTKRFEIALLFGISIPVCYSSLLSNYINTVAPGDNKITMISLARVLPHVLYLAIALIIYKLFGATSGMMLFLTNVTCLIVIIPMIMSEKPLFRKVKDNFQKLNKENHSYGFQVYLGSICGISFGYLGGITLGLFNAENTDVGFFTLAIALAGPMSLIPTTVGTVFFRNFASSEHISPKVLKTTFLLTVLGFLAFFIMIHPVVSLLYPPDYHPVAQYAAWLALGACLNGAGDLFNRFLGAHGQGVAIRNAAIACGAVLVLGNILLVYFLGISGAIITRNIAFFVYCLVLCISYVRFSRNLESNQRKKLTE
jgi:O-antigen/teichoic acid export membrane protein